jgi:hypothetical protein
MYGKKVFVFLLSGLLAGLDGKSHAQIHLRPPDDGSQTGPKHVEAHRVGLLCKDPRLTVV